MILPKPIQEEKDQEIRLIQPQDFALTKPPVEVKDQKSLMDHTRHPTVGCQEMATILFSIIQVNKTDLTLKTKFHQAL